MGTTTCADKRVCMHTLEACNHGSRLKFNALPTSTRVRKRKGETDAELEARRAASKMKQM